MTSGEQTGRIHAIPEEAKSGDDKRPDQMELQELAELSNSAAEADAKRVARRGILLAIGAVVCILILAIIGTSIWAPDSAEDIHRVLDRVLPIFGTIVGFYFASGKSN